VKQKLPARKSALAFSLIEIVIAIGVFSFAIVAIFGLMAISLNSDKGAASDSTLSRIAETTVSQLRSQGYPSFHTNAAYAASDTNADYFFDSSGQLAVTSAGAPQSSGQADSVYSCTVTRKATASTNLDYINLEFRWPMAAPKSRQETKVVNTSFANYY